MLYCHTSALLKLYIEEGHSDRLKSEVAQAHPVAVCRIAWVEAQAAPARRAREVPEDRPVIEAAIAALTTDWPHCLMLEVNQSVVERAGDYADTFALNGYDSLQLAAPFEAGQIAETIVDFACFDVRLNNAAEVLAMRAPYSNFRNSTWTKPNSTGSPTSSGTSPTTCCATCSSGASTAMSSCP